MSWGRADGSRRWTLASLVVAFIALAYFSEYLARLLDALLVPVELAVLPASGSATLRVVQDAFLQVYGLLRGLLTDRLGLAVLLSLSLVLMAFKVQREPA